MLSVHRTWCYRCVLLFKKRIALPGRGKSGGARTILFYQREEKIVFCFGYAKNVKEDMDEVERKSLDCFSKDLLRFGPAEIAQLIRVGKLIIILEMEGGQ